jgi:hypothetical protein
MAVTYIRSVRNDPGRTIRYAADPEKTRGERELVTGINCIPGFAEAQFAQTARWWGKEDGVRCYHLYQSFSSGETWPEEANRIGTELAEKLWGDRFEVIVATHCNTDTVHNHIVINSVSFKDGKKLDNNKETYPEIRRESDRICREHGLSVVRNPLGRRVNWQERQAEKRGLPTIRQTVRNDIDAAVASSATWESFRRFLRERGYEFSSPEKDEETGKGPGLRPRGASGYFRFDSLGRDYTPEEIRQRILSESGYLPERAVRTLRVPEVNARELPLASYVRYLESAYRDPASGGIITLDMRKDMTKLEKYSRMLRRLTDRGISSRTQLRSGKEEIEREISRIPGEERGGSEERQLRELLRETEQAEQAMELAEQRLREAAALQQEQNDAERQREEDRWHTHRTQPTRW